MTTAHPDPKPSTPDVVTELRRIRRLYDSMEIWDNTKPESVKAFTEGKLSWKAWKRVRNVITNRIEELTGERQ